MTDKYNYHIPRQTEIEVEHLMLGMAKRWKGMKEAGFADLKVKNRSLWYAAHRDITHVNMFAINTATKLAAIIRPDLAAEGGPLTAVNWKYTALFSEGEHRVDAHINVIPTLIAGDEDTEDRQGYTEAFVLFCVCLSIVQLMYILLMPNLADTLGDRWPDAAQKAIDGISTVVFVPDDQRAAIIKRMVDSGTLPVMNGMAGFLAPSMEGFMANVIDRLKKDGCIIEEELEVKKEKETT